MKNLEIRNIDNTDCGKILEVYRQCEDFLSLGPKPKATMGMVLEDMKTSKDEGALLRGIYFKKRMVGIIGYAPGGFEGKETQAFISLLMIAAPFRGQEIGKKIVEKVEKEILGNPKIKTIRLGVQANNPSALRFWKRNRYEIDSGPESRPDGTVVFGLSKACRELK